MPNGLGLIGQKVGMTQVFDKDGRAVGATVVLAGPCTVLGVRDPERDGYVAVQLAYGADAKAAKVLSKPRTGQFKKAGIPPHRQTAEFRPKAGGQFPAEIELAPGGKLTVEIFKKGDRVDVQGDSKGHGFQGVVKRHGFRGGPSTHGSMSHRAPGSVGQSTDPGHTLRGTRMGGRQGGKQSTSQNLEVLDVDKDRNLLVLKGAIPGAKGSLLKITPTVKRRAPLPRALFSVLRSGEGGKTAAGGKKAENK